MNISPIVMAMRGACFAGVVCLLGGLPIATAAAGVIRARGAARRDSLRTRRRRRKVQALRLLRRPMPVRSRRSRGSRAAGRAT